jgi:hypothetical protein
MAGEERTSLLHSLPALALQPPPLGSSIGQGLQRHRVAFRNWTDKFHIELVLIGLGWRLWHIAR